MNLYIKVRKSLVSLLTIVLAVLILSSCGGAKYKALIVNGQNNHKWEVSSPVLKQILENSNMFTVDVATSPAKGENMESFTPNFSKYDVIVLDYNGDSWPEVTNKAFVDYVNNGGGVVVFHAANNAFAKWEEYNEIIGLGGWEGRNEKSGPYVYYNRGDSLVFDTAPGRGGSHGPQHQYQVRMRNSEHPITKGLPTLWMHGKDELYSELRGPAKNMEILATAFADTRQKGTGRHEPLLFTISYGKGRIFHTGFGDAGSNEALKCAGFIVTLQRGAEWAASGKVTQEVPIDFPNSVSVILWDNYKPWTLDEIFNGMATYDIGKSTQYITAVQDRLRRAKGDAKLLQDYEQRLVALLSGQSTVEAKKAVLRELSWMGTDYCIPALDKLAGNAALQDALQYTRTRLGK